jgi:predicted nucleic acid-binding Zn ribbon protein
MSTWRPLPGSPPPLPKRIDGALDRLARRLGAPGAVALQVVFGRWEEIVGEEAARHSRPLRLSGGTLVVGVGDPARATELRYRGAQILERVTDVAGGPVAERLEVRVRARR